MVPSAPPLPSMNQGVGVTVDSTVGTGANSAAGVLVGGTGVGQPPEPSRPCSAIGLAAKMLLISF